MAITISPVWSRNISKANTPTRDRSLRPVLDDPRVAGLAFEILRDGREVIVIDTGPMAPDAALRVGLQIVRALGAAAYFNLTHRAIQPSNLMIVSGESPGGGWPFVKLLNFGLASLELHSDSNEAPEIAPSISTQFASP